MIPPELMKCVPRAANNLGQAGLIEDIKMEDATEKVGVNYIPAHCNLYLVDLDPKSLN